MLIHWNSRFPGFEPIAYQARDVFNDRWVRFQGLPGSKRYPENDAEYAEIFQRHNRIMSELARKGDAVFLLSASYSASTEPVERKEAEWQLVDPSAVYWRTVALDPDPTCPSYWHIFVGEHIWRPGLFDRVVRLIADEVIANVMIVAQDCRWLLHPYDGGMDVIAETRQARDDLKSRYPDWLSAHSDGL